MDYPFLLFVVSLVTLWLSAQVGCYLCRRKEDLDEGDKADLSVVLTAALTLLGLIIGFTFSMAITRYDQRKNLESEEANAIGTEYYRAGLLPDAEATRLRGLLKDYLSQRVLFYTATDKHELQRISSSTGQLQDDLWSGLQDSALAQPTPVIALAVSGLNDVLNSQGYTEAAWRNRIPVGAWALMAIIAVCCNILVGYTAKHHEAKPRRYFFVLPFLVSVSFLLIADIDSPRGGMILVRPLNLETVASSLHR
jgi:hypothetical protein